MIKTKDNKTVINDRIPHTQFMGARWNYQDVEQLTATATLNHSFNNQWSLNTALSYQNYSFDYFGMSRIYNGSREEMP